MNIFSGRWRCASLLREKKVPKEDTRIHSFTFVPLEASRDVERVLNTSPCKLTHFLFTPTRGRKRRKTKTWVEMEAERKE